MDLRFERFMFEQKQLPARGAKILEVNLSHPAILSLEDHLESEEAKDIALLIYDQACILEGEELADPAGFAKRFNKLLVR
jgi:molecular chaperone HtpG